VERIEALLEPGERLLWHGRPDTNRLVRRQYGWCFFAGAFFALSLIWAFASWQRGTAIGPFVGLLFAALGLAVAIGQAREIIYARTTRYFVSDRRAAIVKGPRQKIAESYAADEIGSIEIEPADETLSDVRFSRGPRLRGYRGIANDRAGFYGVADAERARRALETLALSAAAR
jgi:hypothetical protein